MMHKTMYPKVKNRLAMCLLLLLSLRSYAQKNGSEYATADAIILAIPAAQTKSTNDIAAYIKNNLHTSTEIVRAIYVWTAANIEYDMDNMYAIDFHEQEADKITKAISTHKGICENYAAVFNELCAKCGIRSFLVAGYTRNKLEVDNLPHVWCAAQIDNVWYLFDPTWGSGYAGKDNRFVKKLNNTWFKVSPEESIRTHMPFDPLWELLYHPITNQEFYEKKTGENMLKLRFSYPDSIDVYSRQDETTQWIETARRIERNGVKNALVYNRLSNLKQNIEINRQTVQVNAHNDIVGIYNEAVVDYNNGVNDLNAFVNYRNNQFNPKKEDAEIQSMLDTADHRITRAQVKVSGLKGDEANITGMITAIQRSRADADKVLGEQKEFLAKYFSKSKLGRKTMFTKYTWMGIPLN